MPSDTDLCNRALDSVGTRSTISSMTEPSPEARVCARWYAATRDQLLRAAHWSFAEKTMTLGLLQAVPGTPENPSVPTTPGWNTYAMPSPGWLYSYAYPNDCIAMRRVLDGTMLYYGYGQPGVAPLFQQSVCDVGPMMLDRASMRFKIAWGNDGAGNQARLVLSNAEQALAIYTAEVTDPNGWDVDFQQALVAALAGFIAIPLTGDKELAKQKFDLANDAIQRGRLADGNEGLTVWRRQPSWIAARSGMGDCQSTGDGYLAPYGSLFGTGL